MDLGIKVEGVDEIVKALDSFAGKTQKKIVRKGVRGGAKVLQKEVARNALKIGATSKGDDDIDMMELIASKIKVKAWKRQKDGAYGVGVILDHDKRFIHIAKKSYSPKVAGAGRSKNRSYIPTAIEYGHIKPDGSFVPGRSFMRKAFDQKKKGVSEEMANKTLKEAEKEWQKLFG
jgi:hypothetical protein